MHIKCLQRACHIINTVANRYYNLRFLDSSPFWYSLWLRVFVPVCMPEKSCFPHPDRVFWGPKWIMVLARWPTCSLPLITLLTWLCFVVFLPHINTWGKPEVPISLIFWQKAWKQTHTWGKMAILHVLIPSWHILLHYLQHTLFFIHLSY